MQICYTNAVVSAQLCSCDKMLTLQDFMCCAHVKFTHRPTMAKFYHHGVTILIFTSLKCRTMGFPKDCNNKNNLNEIVAKHQEILQSFIEKFPWSLTLKNVSLSTATATHQLPCSVTLQASHFMYEPELFSAAKLRLDNDNDSAHVNVFANGKVVCLGIKSQGHVESLLRHLYGCLFKNEI